MLKGQKVVLRPATLADQRLMFEWLTQSDITANMMGPPLFPEIEVPCWEDFSQDYNSKYFSDRDAFEGRSFIILFKDEPVGHINYNDIDRASRTVELDIWLRGKAYTRKGFGTDAILTLCSYLQQELGCRKVFLAPSVRNPDAVNAYKKCGFRETSVSPPGFAPDYSDAIVLLKEMSAVME